ncbi:MAG: ECF transporter S component [Sarcina sp.]
MMKQFTTKRLVNIALFSAICFIGTWIHFPINIGGGTSMIHLGTTAIFLTAIFLGEDAAWSGAIGCALFDATNPQFMAWVIPTFVLKGLMGYVAGKIAYLNNSKGSNLKLNIIAFLIAGIVSLVGYFIVNWVIFVGLYGAIVKMTTSIITTSIAIIISIPLLGVKPIINKAIGYNR